MRAARIELCVVLLLVLFSCVVVVFGFSDGMKLSQGSSAARKIYCNRPPNRRGPLHFHKDCNGFCEPLQDLESFYTLNVSSSTYWLGAVRVNISARPASGKSVTGFSIYAIDENEFVAGSFDEDSTNVLVGTCRDIITVTDETHAAFHKMADNSRKNISIVWQPDGLNHERVKFVIWVVNNHSDAYYGESQWLTSEKNGHESLDVVSNLKNIVSTVDMETFEKSFKYRSTRGYQLDLTDPFALFSKSPSKSELVPLNVSQINGSQTEKSATPNAPIQGQVVVNESRGLETNDKISNSTIDKISINTTNIDNSSLAQMRPSNINSNKTTNNLESRTSSNDFNKVISGNGGINITGTKDPLRADEDGSKVSNIDFTIK